MRTLARRLPVRVAIREKGGLQVTFMQARPGAAIWISVATVGDSVRMNADDGAALAFAKNQRFPRRIDDGNRTTGFRNGRPAPAGLSRGRRP